MPELVHSDYSRLFLLEGGADPLTVPRYMSLWRAGALTWDQGDVTLIYIPDPDYYQRFKVAGKIKGEPSNPELGLTARYTLDRSDLLRLLVNGCDHDLQIHFGTCRNPRNFNSGWDKILVLSNASPGSYSTGELGALEPSQRAQVDEESTFRGEFAYEIVRLAYSQKAAAETTEEVLDVAFGTADQCLAICGQAECKIILALMAPVAYAKARYAFSADGGLTWTDGDVDSAAADDLLSAIVNIGSDAVVVNPTAGAIDYCVLADLLAGTPTWVEVATGFVLAGVPRAIWSAGPAASWIVGDAGYIYLMSNVADGVSIQDAGSATSENLVAVSGESELNVLAVGENNAVVFTNNGGQTWGAVTGPNAGVNLTACWMKTELVWLVGDSTGKLWVTADGGITWYEKAFVGSGAGMIEDIHFVTNSVGYLAHTTTAPAGRILRTIDGGQSWYVLPEGSGAIPTNLAIHALAGCTDANLIFGGGLVANAAGIVVAAA
jgi:photosystem II stability/assembly factor-like uncharacterized protein